MTFIRSFIIALFAAGPFVLAPIITVSAEDHVIYKKGMSMAGMVKFIIIQPDLLKAAAIKRLSCSFIKIRSQQRSIARCWKS